MTKEEQLKFIKKAKKSSKDLTKECLELWQYSVKIRANHRCEYYNCRYNYEKLDAHHYFSKGAYPHLKYDVENGICLCVKHHTAGFSKESAHSDPNFNDKILGRYPGFKPIRSENWAKKMNWKAYSKSYKLDLQLEKLCLIQELKKHKEYIKNNREKFDKDLINYYNL